MNLKKNFVVIGAGGHIAHRHFRAIYDTGNEVIAAIDPIPSLGVLDKYSLEIEFFPSFNEFINHTNSHGFGNDSIDYAAICSPNYLHHQHCKKSLELGMDVICEKPLVIHPRYLDILRKAELQTGRKINAVLQARMHPKLRQLQSQLLCEADQQHDVELTYITPRGKWYHHSWKGTVKKSGGLIMNIGIHFLDIMIWLFGNPVDSRVYCKSTSTVSGFLELERARVRWFLSIDGAHNNSIPTKLPPRAFRSISIDGAFFDFSDGFEDLHTLSYRSILVGQGFSIEDARPSISLAHHIQSANVRPIDALAHSFLLSHR